MATLTETLVRSSIHSMCKYTVSWLLKVGLGPTLSVTCTVNLNFMGSSLSQESHQGARTLFTKATEKFWNKSWGRWCESEDRMNQRMRREGDESEFALTSTHWCDLLLLITLWEWFHSPAAFTVGISVLIFRYHRTSVRLAVLVFSSQEGANRNQSQK